MASDNRDTSREVFFTAQAANGFGDPMNVQPFKNINIALHGSGTAAFTVKVMGSDQKAVPDWTAAASATNDWSYIGTWDLDPVTIIAGSTGYVFAGDATARLLVNTDTLTHINVEVSGYSAGALTATVSASTNE